jgi:hypothetical protein
MKKAYFKRRMPSLVILMDYHFEDAAEGPVSRNRIRNSLEWQNVLAPQIVFVLVRNKYRSEACPLELEELVMPLVCPDLTRESLSPRESMTCMIGCSWVIDRERVIFKVVRIEIEHRTQ